MWHLKRIIASNICAFESFDYFLTPSEATLIFGDNQDSDSQNSNGSGKSALIEAIAIGLTGDPLRKVNIDEIINDRKEEAIVSIYLQNPEMGCIMTINRRLSRKQPQQIQIIRQYGPYDTDVEEVAQASVADYNKYILDQIGLSKDDILSNFILTARKYKSFLSCSDKEKKEIINRFSNGVIVDESIEALHQDMQPIEEELVEAEKYVARCNGSISAMESEIERAINESQTRQASKQARIEGWKQAISEKRADIRSNRASIERLDRDLDAYDALDEEMQKLEKSDIDTATAYRTIAEKFALLNFAPIANYTVKIQSEEESLKTEKTSSLHLSESLKKTEQELETLTEEFDIISKANKKSTEELDSESEQVQARINELVDEANKLKQKGRELSASRTTVNQSIATIEKQLAGVIECPKCHHEFTFDINVNVAEARNTLAALQKKLARIESQISQADTDYESTVAFGKKQRERQSEIADERRSLKEKYNRAYQSIVDLKNELASIERKIDASKSRLAKIQETLSGLRKKMFDEVFDAIDHYIRQAESSQDALTQSISSLEGAIRSYEEQIAEAEKATDDDVLVSLKSSKEKYEADLQEALQVRESVQNRLNELKVQESTFVDFKTYLANTKINAIAQITNDFLATIGSDIRVALSGYTILKSGKVRDKISVSVMRDGIDCGSFEKFSAGERVRLELASILAMRQLTNVNAEEGKGLDLLICDEILDSSDESGLTNIFKALNSTGITSLVVSHGSVAENYPNRLVVHKQNGVSYLDGNTKQ